MNTHDLATTFLFALSLCLVGTVGAASLVKPSGRDITRTATDAALTEHQKYPSEMVAGPQGFDGAYSSVVTYKATSEGLSVNLWESGPGVLRTEAYPYDEFCRVLEGRLIITNASGTRAEYGPGDSFVIPKGWAGTWDMPTKFKKQYVIVHAPR